MSSSLRSRGSTKVPNDNAAESDPTVRPSTKTSDSNDEDGPTRLSVTDVLRILGGLLLLSSTLSYFITGESIFWNYRPAFTRPVRIKAWLLISLSFKRGPLNLSDAQLSLYNGTNPTLPILVALNGTIYDVSASPHMYGPGGSYHFFAGRDATRAFVTGCFDTDLVGDLRGVEEMFMPKEADAEAEGDGDGVISKEERRERKLRREKERRVARGKVRDTVKGWEKMFDGGKGGKYFRVGRVERGPGSGWGGWGEVRELCLKAREGRPRRTAEEVE